MALAILMPFPNSLIRAMKRFVKIGTANFDRNIPTEISGPSPEVIPDIPIGRNRNGPFRLNFDRNFRNLWHDGKHQITLANYKSHRQSSEPIKIKRRWSKTQSKHKNACKRIMIGLGFTSILIGSRTNWREMFLSYLLALLTVNVLIYFLLQIKKRSTRSRLFRTKESKENMCYPVSYRNHRDSWLSKCFGQ